MRTCGVIAVAAILAAGCNQTATPVATRTPVISGSPAATPANLVAVTPAAGFNATLAWDGVDRKIMMVSPVSDPVTRLTSLGAWTLEATGWKPMAAPALVADDRGFGPRILVFDSARKVEVLLTSTITPPQTTVVREWDGSSWRNVTASTAPVGALMGAYGPDLRAVVAIDNGAPTKPRTWLYDGAGWRRAIDGVVGDYRGMVAMAYDEKLHAVVALSAFFKTWRFDGSTWTSNDVEPPVPAGSSAVAFDPQAGQWIVFGGWKYTEPVEDATWTGDGRSWTKLSPKVSPPARWSMSSGPTPNGETNFAWDPETRTAILFGGLYSYCCELVYSDTWRWDGKSWTKLLGSPPLADPTLLASTRPCKPTSSYGLLVAGGKIVIVDTCGKATASAPIAATSVQACTDTGLSPVLEPAVSATNDKIFFRDGDTKIRSLTLSGEVADITTVPGGATSVSFFSVSPDDRRIVVLVEDLSSPSAVKIRLYAEDLVGAGHHLELYSATIAKAGGNTLWPMGWHSGQLVLALIAACAKDPSTVSPVEWHLVSPDTGKRTATVRPVSCVLGRWPSRGGFSCATFGYATLVYDWKGAYARSFGTGTDSNEALSGVSPSGKSIFVASTVAVTCSGRGTCVAVGTGTSTDPTRVALADERYACLWIDDDNILAPDAIIGTPLVDFPTARYVPVAKLASAGTCAGRYPGGL